MSIWEIREGITEITADYTRTHMPPGTTELVIPKSVRSIGDGAFFGCTTLEAVCIPSSSKPQSTQFDYVCSFNHRYGHCVYAKTGEGGRSRFL